MRGRRRQSWANRELATLLARTLGVVTVLAASTALAATPGEAEPGGPSARLVPVETPAGPRQAVRVEGLAPGIYTLSLCGNEGRRASEDCDLPGSRGIEIRPGGAATAILPTAPPVGCPCVARIVGPSGDPSFTVPIELPGVAFLSPEERPLDPFVAAARQRLQVVAVEAGPSGKLSSWSSSLGLPASVRVSVRLRNAEETTLRDVVVSASAGRPGEVSHAVEPSVIPVLEPGAEQVAVFDVPLDAPSWGDWEAGGTVAGAGAPVAWTASWDSAPFGWLVAGPVLVALAVTTARRRRRPNPGPPSGEHRMSDMNTRRQVPVADPSA